MTTSLNEGDILAGKYKVERILGKGGMGVVVAARHMMLGERMAIKLLLPHARQSEELVARFLREGRAAARIRSEHVARVFDVGTLATSEPYLVMEYIEGNDLGATLRERGRLPAPEVCEYVLQACEALAEAHALGIIHRDLKPSNLFLGRRADGAPQIKVIDFGISKVTARADEAGAEPRPADMTQTSVMMGSPLYMAPEQMHSAKGVDARSDIWSIGVILHQLLSGEVPHKGGSVMEIFESIIAGAPPLRAICPDIPERLEAIVRKCLQRNPDDRYRNVGELAAELADLAPPHARISADRIARVLHMPPSSSSAGAAPRATSPSASDISSTGSKKGVNAASPPPSPSLSEQKPSLTDGSWGGTQAPAPLRRGAGSPLRAAIVIGAAAAVATSAWLMLRGPSAPVVTASEPSPSAEVAPTQEAQAPATGQSTAVVPGPPEGAASSVLAPSVPAASGAASAKTTPATPIPSTSAASPPGQKPRLPPRPAPKEDLFGDPR
jgi:serine/threonine-protein kinase